MKQRGRKGSLKLAVFGKPQLVVAQPPHDLPPPPDHLGEPERAIWDGVVRDYRGTDASLALLTTGLEAHMRARECREAIAREGLVVLGRDDQAKAHPLLAVERAALRAFQQTFKALGIKV